MQIKCPWCEVDLKSDRVYKIYLLNVQNKPLFVKSGYFRRSSDRVKVQRFQCKVCERFFSGASFSLAYGQKKRHKNEPLRRLLASGVSMRRASLLLNIHRQTVTRKLKFLGTMAKARHLKFLSRSKDLFRHIQFDEMETFEHSKCKPISIPLMVDSEKRKILWVDVGSMPAKGLLSEISRKKYGYRKDERPEIINNLMTEMKKVLHPNVDFLTDKNPRYTKIISQIFPTNDHKTVKGVRGCKVGGGELKKIGYDPLFSLNHTCAMIRSNVNRLFRRTWCTTKKAENLRSHIWIYLDHHNRILTPA